MLTQERRRKAEEIQKQTAQRKTDAIAVKMESLKQQQRKADDTQEQKGS